MNVLFFRWFLWLARRELSGALGAEGAERMRSAAPEQLRLLLPRIPEIGRSGAHSFLVATAMLVAFHRALPLGTVAVNAGLFSDVVRARLQAAPRPVRSLYRWMFFQPWYHRRLFASLVGERGSTGAGFVGTFVEGQRPGEFGVDYSECALQKFLGAVGASELGPHVCQLDFVESEVFGLGLVRTGTIGQGARGCDFRWHRPTV